MEVYGYLKSHAFKSLLKKLHIFFQKLFNIQELHPLNPKVTLSYLDILQCVHPQIYISL